MTGDLNETRVSAFKLLDAYTVDDRAVFFGREREIEELHTRVLNERITLLYGASGTGKTSLIQCGLADKFSSFSDPDWLPLFVRRGHDLVDSTLQAVRSAATTAIEETAGLVKALESLYLDHFKPIYLVFDQFEEAFIFGTRQERAAFGAEVRQVLSGSANTHLIFVIREEYFAHLTELEENEPSFLENRMRVERMTRAHTIEVIEGSCQAANVALEESFAAELLEKVFPEGREVDLAHLQIFLDRLWKRATKADNGTLRFTRELLEQEGRIGDILGEFLDDQTRQMEDPERAIRVLKAFVSREGTKARATAVEVVSFCEGIGQPLAQPEVEESLRDLVGRRILKEKDDSGGYELSHDSLAAKVYERISQLERELLEVREMLLGRYNEWLKRRVLLSADDLEYIAPYESRLYQKPEVQEFVAASKLALAERERKRRRRVAVIAGCVIGALAIVTMVVFYMAIAARRSERHAIEQQRRHLFVEAADRIERERSDEAIAYLCEAARLGDSAASARLASLLTQRLWPVSWLVLGQEGSYPSAEFSPDGAHVVTASWSKTGPLTAQVWNARTGLPIGEPLRHDGYIGSAHFSADGNFVVTASQDKSARVWDAKTGKPLTDPMRHEELVSSARFSPDGTRVVTTSWDKTARVWDAKTGQPITGSLHHEWVVESAYFSPDGTRVVTASGDKTARVWDARTGKPLTSPLHHEKPVTSALFSPDGAIVLTASWDKTARLWEVRTGKLLIEPLHHEDWVTSAEFSPDGTKVLTASRDKTARIWDSKTGHPLTEPLRHDDWINSARFSADGTRVVTASQDGNARIWDAVTGKPLSENFRHDSPVHYAQFSTDGVWIVTASKDAARVWEARVGKTITAQSFEFRPAIARISPDGTRIVTASMFDEAPQVLDIKTGKRITELRHELRVDSAQFSPDGTRVVTASWDKTARVWDARTGKSLTVPLRHDSNVLSAHFSPNGNRIVTISQDNAARVWDARTGKPLTEPLRHEAEVNSANFSPDGAFIVTASQDKMARIWDIKTSKPVQGPFRHDEWVTSAEFSRDGSQLLTASSDGIARVWDVRTGKPIGKPMRHESIISSATFSKDGTRIVTASHDRTARVWDAATLEPVTEPLRHDDTLSSASFSPDGSKLVTASWDNTARVWDTKTGKPLADPFRHNGANARFTPDGARVVAMGEFAQVWDVGLGLGDPPPWFLALAEAIAGLQLSETGTLRTIPAKQRFETIQQCRERVNRNPNSTDLYVLWARWFFADPETRTVSPFSTITVREQREREAAWKARPWPASDSAGRRTN